MATLFSWDSGTLPTVSGAVTPDSSAGFPTAPSLLVAQVSGVAAYAQWSVSSPQLLSVRCYIKTPSAWAASAAPILNFNPTTSSTAVQFAIAGTGAPGQVRLTANGTVAAQSANNVIALSTWYRVEMLQNVAAGTARLVVFPINSDTAIYDSGMVSGTSFTTAATLVRLGRPNTTPQLGSFSIDSVVGTDILALAGRAAGDDLPAPAIVTPTIWTGNSEVAVVSTSIWNGSQEVAVSSRSVWDGTEEA